MHENLGFYYLCDLFYIFKCRFAGENHPGKPAFCGKLCAEFVACAGLRAEVKADIGDFFFDLFT